MATESNTQNSSAGTKTYRGRTLEEILPQIRAELGPDAIILREREGLVGGVGGFFAQRFIEVDARRGDGQSIDIYDDAPESDLRSQPRAYEPEIIEGTVKPELPPEPVNIGPRAPLPLPEPVQRRPEPKPFLPPAIKLVEPPAPAPQPVTRKFETNIFMDRLREASAVIPDDDVIDLPEAEFEPPAAKSRKPRATAKPKAKPAAKPKPKAPATNWSDEVKAMPVADLETATARDLVAALPPEPEPEPIASARPVAATKPKPAPARRQSAAKPQRKPRPAAARPPAKPAPRRPEERLAETHTNPYESIRRRPRSIAPDRPLPTRTPPSRSEPLPMSSPAAPAATAVATLAAPAPSRAEPRHRHQDNERRSTLLTRLVESLRPAGPTKPAPAKPLDVVAATEVATELATRGASQAWTTQLISAAGAHGSALTGNLRQAAEAEVARRIVPAPALPATGAAIAFIGAGGAGKTRCTAALASAYRRNSTLEVTVIALDNPDGARELRRLLHDDGVPVLSLHGARAARAVAESRNGGLVIVDTPTATPTDPAAVDALGATLEPLGLDAVYVALPATLGPQAARRALASFGSLKPAAVAITHADETDQLAVVVEIAIGHRIPLAYFHSGTDHRTALSVVDPPSVAQQLLS